MVTPSPLSELRQLIGIEHSLDRLEEALTHASYVNEHPTARDYERLEFLGDAVLGLCVSELLLEQAPGASEGRLTRMRAALVNTRALAAFAVSVDLARFIRFGRGASSDAGQSKVLADVVEAIVAVCYLHGGLDSARALTRRIVGDLHAALSDLGARDAKSLLQEVVQARGSGPPIYRTIAVEGPDHDRWFEIVVEFDGQAQGRGRGRTKKQAEQEAAQSALKQETAKGKNAP